MEIKYQGKTFIPVYCETQRDDQYVDYTCKGEVKGIFYVLRVWADGLTEFKKTKKWKLAK